MKLHSMKWSMHNFKLACPRGRNVHWNGISSGVSVSGDPFEASVCFRSQEKPSYRRHQQASVQESVIRWKIYGHLSTSFHLVVTVRGSEILFSLEGTLGNDFTIDSYSLTNKKRNSEQQIEWIKIWRFVSKPLQSVENCANWCHQIETSQWFVLTI